MIPVARKLNDVLMREPTASMTLRSWVNGMARLCQPNDVIWCDDSEGERICLTRMAIENGEVEELSP